MAREALWIVSLIALGLLPYVLLALALMTAITNEEAGLD